MTNFNEHALEMSIMQLFKEQGYTYISGDQIHRERTEVLLADDLKQYLYSRYAKDGITPSEVESIVLMLRNTSGTLYEAISAALLTRRSCAAASRTRCFCMPGSATLKISSPNNFTSRRKTTTS